MGSIVKEIEESVKWYSHTIRMNEQRKPKQVFEARSQGQENEKAERGMEDIKR